MNRIALVAALALVACGACTHDKPAPVVAEPVVAVAPEPDDPRVLRSVSAFDGLPTNEARSIAMFTEATKVMRHPRCSNCHPAGDSPLQGLEQHPHEPPVTRGPEDHGVVGMQCTTCHQRQNQVLARVPGAPKWSLAPIQMAWVGRTPRQLCEQLKDRARNGDKSLDEIVHHSAHDELLAWGWVPGAGREPAPGSQRTFGLLMAGWVETGAHCPQEVLR